MAPISLPKYHTKHPQGLYSHLIRVQSDVLKLFSINLRIFSVNPSAAVFIFSLNSSQQDAMLSSKADYVIKAIHLLIYLLQTAKRSRHPEPPSTQPFASALEGGALDDKVLAHIRHDIYGLPR
jgi:hypothetical protein